MISLREPLREEAGFGLIEVLVSALLVVLISLAVLGAMDSASRASGASKSKAVAANLAQQDQERLQAMRPSDVAAIGTQTPARSVPVTEGGATVSYSVRSEGQYVVDPNDPGGDSGCTSGGRDEYLKIVSTVSWPSMRGVKPVRIESLVTPPFDGVSPGKGSAALRVTRADGTTAAMGLSVRLTGSTTSGLKLTGANGCAFFAQYPVGSYAFELSQSGWVDPDGDQAVSLPIGIASQEVASLDTLYDESGRVLNAGFKTRAPNGNNSATRTMELVAARGSQLTLSNSGVVPSGIRQFNATTSGTTDTATATNLFPFTSPYSVYSSGGCGQALTGALASSVSANGGTEALTVVRKTDNPGRWVFEPALNPTVRYNGALQAGARVFVKSTNPACPTSLPVQTTLGTPTARVGTLPERGFPYSGATYAYSICADYQVPSGTYSGRYRNSGWQTKRNDQFDGVSWSLNIAATTGGSAPCQ